MRLGDKVAVSGGCGDTISLLKAADQLIMEGRTGHRELSLFQSWDELVEFSEREAGSDLAPLVRLVNAHDIDELISILEKNTGLGKVRQTWFWPRRTKPKAASGLP